MMSNIKTVAIYLPQFHPVPENDEWWGPGFTEWTNVKKSKPLYKGHNQPKIPHSSVGYYDLGEPDVMVKQAALAKEHGIYGFAFYHYWFNGKRLLDLPMDNLLKNNKPDFPFCLFWANETWSRRWLGEEKEILIKQTYSEEDDNNHIDWLIKVFSDKRYIKVGNKPVFIIYRPLDFPDIRKTLSVFTEKCLYSGLEKPYFIASNSHAGDIDLTKYGFENILNFEPQLGVLPGFMDDRKSLKKLISNIKLGVFNSKLKLFDYSKAKELMLNRNFLYSYLPCSFVAWDNTPRRGKNGIVLKNSDPAIFKKYFAKSVNALIKMNFKEEENFIFINAWNEWAEGNCLEPDIKYDFQYLEAVKEVIESEVNE
jgi:hypothetical protein